MATVYKAFDTRLERDVAVKIIRVGQFGQDVIEHILKRFEREAKALARLTHPNIVHVNDFGEHEGVPYLVMDYLSGGTLKEHMRLPMPWQAATRLLIPVASALDYAHQNKIIHRDVKPANILLTASGQPMLTDFGIAKILETEAGQTLTGTGVGIGTPEYMAPEQGMGRLVDGRADIYSLGIVFYELVTAHKPYTADTPMAVVFKHISDPLPDPREFMSDLPESVARGLFKALAKQPEDRYARMSDFEQALEALLANPASPQPAQEVKAAEKTPAIAQEPVIANPDLDTTVIDNPGTFDALDVAVPNPEPQVGQKTRSLGLWIGLGVLGMIAIAVLVAWLANGEVSARLATATHSFTPTTTQTRPPSATITPGPEYPIGMGIGSTLISERDGMTLVSALIQQGLVDEFHLFVNPAAIGSGLSIFKDLNRKQNLKLVKVLPFECGIVVLNYELRRD